MSRYIDADAFEKYLNREEWETPDEKWWPEREIGMILDVIPTADVVEVVRCKDCANWQIDWIPTIGGDKGCHYCEMFDSSTEPLNYCGYAIKRQVLGGDKH